MISDIFILTSIPTRKGAREGILVLIMEGMAVDLPNVASNISDIPEQVENGLSGFLTPVREVIALTKSTGVLIEENSLRRKMGAAAREAILRDFNLESNARQLIHMLQAACTSISR